MTSEQIYDTEIAPKLLEVAKRCQELGFAIVASVEWAPSGDQRGRTEFCPATTGETRPTAAQLLVHYAARCNGNVDSLLMAVIRDVKQFGHSSMYLHQLGIPTAPSEEGK